MAELRNQSRQDTHCFLAFSVMRIFNQRIFTVHRMLSGIELYVASLPIGKLVFILRGYTILNCVI